MALEHKPGDAALILAIAERQDREAFTELYQRFRRPAYSVAFHFLHDQALAEEAVQEALLTVWETAPMFRHQTNAKGWILSLVVTKSLMLARSRKRSQKREERKSAMDCSDVIATVSAGLEKQELMQALRSQLDQLPDLERQLLTLYYGAELPQQEISNLLSIPRQTISAKIQNSLKRLKLDLTKAGFGAVAPLLTPAGLNEALLSGHEPSPGMYENVMRRITALDAHDPQKPARSTHSTQSTHSPQRSSRVGSVVKPVATSTLLMAGALGAGLLGAGALWWSHATTQVPMEVKSAAPFARNWDFNTPEAPEELKPVQDTWQWKAQGGPDGSGCMETKGDIFVTEINIPPAKLPLMITYRCKRLDSVLEKSWANSLGWSKRSGVWVITEHFAYIPGQWMKVRACVTEKFIQEWVDDKEFFIMLSERKEGAALRLSLEPHQLLDDLSIREIAANEIPDVSKYRALTEKLEPTPTVAPFELPGIAPTSGIPARAIYLPPIDSYTQNAELPAAPHDHGSGSGSSSALFSRTWSFNSPEIPKDITVLEGAWHYEPQGGPNGTGCMETDTYKFAARLEVSAPHLPLLLSYGVFRLDAKGKGGSHGPLLGSAPKDVINVHFPQPNRDGLLWERLNYYLTPEFIDLWNTRTRYSVWVGPQANPETLGIVLFGRYRINNLMVREISNPEVPDVSNILAAVAKIAPEKRVGSFALPDLKAEVADQPVTVKFSAPGKSAGTEAEAERK